MLLLMYHFIVRMENFHTFPSLIKITLIPIPVLASQVFCTYPLGYITLILISKYSVKKYKYQGI